MKKITFTILFFFVFAFGTYAQDMNTVFRDMPRDIIYGLTPEMTKELVADPKDTTKFVGTAIYEKITRTAINSEYISLNTSEVGTTEIRLLPLVNGSKIICVVQTVASAIDDSRISFYTDKWKKIDGSSLFPKLDKYWFLDSEADKSDEKFENAMLAIDMFPMKATLSVDENSILLEFDAKGFLSIEDYKRVKPFLAQEPKILKWDEVSFK